MTASKLVLSAASGVGGAGLDVDEVFNTFLYEGTGSSRSITNGIDLSGEGGLVWIKNRNNTGYHHLFDTARGTLKALYSNDGSAEATWSNSLTSFNSDGFSLGNSAQTNQNQQPIVSWTFRKAPNFFDVVTYTGNATARTISHNLGSVPGMIIVKRVDSNDDWWVYHRGNTNAPETDYLRLNEDNGTSDSANVWNDTAPTATEFSIKNNSLNNANGGQFIAYLFAHNNNDGEFGPDSDQDIIKCGSYTGNGSKLDINLGFEAQWVMVKRTDNSSDWHMFDVMRGMPVGSDAFWLEANTSNPEANNAYMSAHSTGFTLPDGHPEVCANGGNYIYMAIRRGPLNTPTNGTDVFSTLAYTGNGSSSRAYDVGSNVCDMLHQRARANSSYVFPNISTRLVNKGHKTSGSNSEFALSHRFDKQNGIRETGFENTRNQSSETYLMHSWSRAPGYFDIVSFTGNGSNRQLNHNLGVTPEMMWVKCRSDFFDWIVYHKDLDASNPGTKALILNTTGAAQTSNELWNGGNYPEGPNKDTFHIGANNNVNKNNEKYIAFLFASASGVSKVGSVSHSFNSTTNVDCGFSSGARFVMVKSTASGEWRVWDSTRGIVAGNDPYIHWNDNTVEVTNGDLIDPYSGGFALSPGFYTDTYIFYAIA